MENLRITSYEQTLECEFNGNDYRILITKSKTKTYVSIWDNEKQVARAQNALLNPSETTLEGKEVYDAALKIINKALSSVDF